MISIRYVVGLSLTVLASVGANASDQTLVVVSPTVLHALAISTTLPEYPRTSFSAKHVGVVVAQVTVSTNGYVAVVQILQSPDEIIGRTVAAALKQWTFHPFSVPGRGAVPVKSRLIFYFGQKGDAPMVIDAVAVKPPAN